MSALVIGAIGVSAAQSFFGGKASKYSQLAQQAQMRGQAASAAAAHKVKQFKYETDAKLAGMNGKNTALELTREFNKTMASNAVMAVAQGRRGGSVEAIARASETQYNWDLDFEELSRDIQVKGLESMALSHAKAAEAPTISAPVIDTSLSGMFGSLANSYLQYSMIGGSTKTATKTAKAVNVGGPTGTESAMSRGSNYGF